MAQALAVEGGPRVVAEGRIQPWPHIGEDERKAVLRALDYASPWRYPHPEVEGLEREWAQFVRMKYCLAANSGTASLHMAVASAEIGPGDEVLVPAFTFLASASCVLHSNGIPIFVDIERDTCCIDPALLEERITDRTKAIVAVDIHGLPCDYDRILAVARKHGLVVIEDGAQAHGSVYKGRQVGALGEVAGCSLNGSKNLSALGEGGLFTTDDEKRFDLAARTRMFGEAVEPGQPRAYNAYMMGWNYRMDPLQAAFTRAQLLRLPQLTEWRQSNCSLLTDRDAGGTAGPHALVLLLPGPREAGEDGAGFPGGGGAGHFGEVSQRRGGADKPLADAAGAGADVVPLPGWLREGLPVVVRVCAAGHRVPSGGIPGVTAADRGVSGDGALRGRARLPERPRSDGGLRRSLPQGAGGEPRPLRGVVPGEGGGLRGCGAKVPLLHLLAELGRLLGLVGGSIVTGSRTRFRARATANTVSRFSPRTATHTSGAWRCRLQ